MPLMNLKFSSSAGYMFCPPGLQYNVVLSVALDFNGKYWCWNTGAWTLCCI